MTDELAAVEAVMDQYVNGMCEAPAALSEIAQIIYGSKDPS